MTVSADCVPAATELHWLSWRSSVSDPHYQSPWSPSPPTRSGCQLARPAQRQAPTVRRERQRESSRPSIRVDRRPGQRKVQKQMALTADDMAAIIRHAANLLAVTVRRFVPDHSPPHPSCVHTA